MRQRNDFRADNEVKSGAKGKSNDIRDKPEPVRMVSFRRFWLFLPCRPIELFANFGPFTKFVCRFRPS